MPSIASSSSSSPSAAAPPSLLDPEDTLLGAPHFRLLKWVYQYIAAFPALTRTREDLASLLEGQVEEGLPGATAQSLRLCLEETELRATLRQCVDCLHRSEELYHSVEPGLALLKKVAAAAAMDFTVGSSLFDLTQLVLLHAAMQAAHATAVEERSAVERDDDDSLDAAASRSDELLTDLFIDRTDGWGASAVERRELQRIMRKLHNFCRSYRDLVRHAHQDREAKKQVQSIQRLFPHSALESSLSAVVVEMARTLQLPFPMLNLIEHEFITRKLTPKPPPQQPPSPTSVVQLPALPVISVPPPAVVKPAGKPVGKPAGKPVGKPAGNGVKKVVGKAAEKKAVASPAQGGGGVVGGQLKAARKQLSRRGVDPLHASIDDATTLQAEEEAGEEEEEEQAEKPPAKRRGRPSKAAVQEEDEEEEARVEEEDDDVMEASQPRSQRKAKAVTRSAPEESEEEEVEKEVSAPKRPRRNATTRNYEETVSVDSDEGGTDDGALNGAANEDEEEEEEEVAPVKRTVKRSRSGGKPAGSGKRKASTSPSRSPATKKKARVSAPSSPSSPEDSAARRVGYRNADRRPFSAEEVRWLKKGVIRFATNGRKWHMILHIVSAPIPHQHTPPHLTSAAHSVGCGCAHSLIGMWSPLCRYWQYGQHFHDRTAVDLKDKWRNIQIKVTDSHSHSHLR